MGTMDNFLTEDEKKYFESGGANEESIKYEETDRDDASREDNEPEQESSGESVSTDARRDDEAEAASSTDDEYEAESDSDPTDEKSSKRDYEKAFKTERHKRKELKEALEAQAKKTSEIEAMLNAMKQTQNEEAKRNLPREEIPDQELDPLGYQQYKVNQLEKYVSEQNKYLQNQHEAQKAQAQKNAFLESYKNQAAQFAEKAKDFPDAYKFLTKAKMDEFVAAGFSHDEANSLLLEDEMGIVAKAYQDKVNPAERIYKLAKARGFNTITKAKNSSVKDLENIEKGVKASKSLKDGGSNTFTGELGMEDIDNMDSKQFNEFFEKLKRQQKGR